MKTLLIANGETLKGFELSDLSKEVRDKVIMEHCTFLQSLPIECEDESGEMHEEYRGFTQEEVIENIEVNEYLFNEAGDIIPLVHYVGKHPLSGQVYYKIGKKEYLVKFI